MASSPTNRLRFLAIIAALLMGCAWFAPASAQGQSAQGGSQADTQGQAPSAAQAEQQGPKKTEASAQAEAQKPGVENSRKQSDPPTMILPHSESSRYWISGQMNFILQWHPVFPARYSGSNSLRPEAEHAGSRVLTLYTGWQARKTTELLCDVESAGGRGISEAFGLAGFTNLDVVRNPTLGSKPYIARVMLHQIISLSHERVKATRNPLALATDLPARRLELRIGKFGMADFFDLNSYGSDSHLQFLNWTVDNNGGYDYAADTRGYTYGIIAEYQDRSWGVRFAEALMPQIANGIDLEWNLRRARSENLEAELRRQFLAHRDGVARVTAYVNHANMGSYRQAIDDFLAGRTPVPDITAHPFKVTAKYGFGFNFEQNLTDWLAAFGRFGWNEGLHESFTYTEVNLTVELGASLNGKLWRRRLDRAGAALATNGISGDHKRYLALGGHGFLLGDGRLTYNRETIVESFYTVHTWRGIFGSFILQYINNPGYNRDRGPVVVPAVRLHLDF